MTRNCLNVMRKIASLNKLSTHPSKYPNRQAWMNSNNYTFFNSVDRDEMRAEEWDDWEKERQMTDYARRTGQSTDNMTGTFRGGRMAQFNGQPVRANADQSNSKNELPRQWFDNAGYTEQEYNKYKGWGYSLNPARREQMIHRQIQMDRRSSNPPAGYSTAKPVTPNESNTATTQSPTAAHRHPVAPTPVSGTRNSVNYRTGGVPIDEHVFDRWRATPAERDKYRYEFQNLPYDRRNTAVFEAIHKDRRANKTARYKEIVDGSFNKDQSPSYMPLEDNPIDDPSFNGEDTPVSVEPQENSYEDAKERQEVLSTAQTQEQGLDMSDMPGFSGLEYKAPESLNRIPSSLRGTGRYTPSPSKLPERDINDMFSGGIETSYSGFKSPEVGNTDPREYKQPEAVQGLQHVLQEVTQPSQPVDTPKPTVEAPKAPEAPKYPQASVKDTAGDGVFRPKDAVEAQYYTKKEIAPGVRSLRID